jgi:hypothetical protein
MLQFELEREGDGTKYCRKMKWMQRAYLDSIGRKRDTAWRRRTDIGWRKDNTGEGKARRRC